MGGTLMLILAMDTAGPSVSVALWRDGQLLAETTSQTGQPHSTTLLPLTSSLLEQCGLAAGSPDAYACTVGPGSYTGIRIAVSTIKAMAYAAGKPAYGFSTLAAMAWPYFACPDLLVCPMIDARNNRLFAGAWLNGHEVVPAANCLDTDFVGQLRTLVTNRASGETFSGLLLVGHQPDAFFESCGKPVIPGTSQAPALAVRPRAAAVGEMAEIRLLDGESGDPQLLMPQYLSPSQAERRRAVAHE